VIDSSDKERMDKVKEELFFVLEEEELKNSPFVIMANKQVTNEIYSRMLTVVYQTFKYSLPSYIDIRTTRFNEYKEQTMGNFQNMC
jgi:hypothetical protein